MSYEPLALKYRPRLLSEMVGQEHVTDGLRAAIDGGRTAHAYLFCGPRGTGKTTAARILARCLNCDKGPTAEPCGECPPCLAAIDGASLDVLEIDAASQRKVEDTEDWITAVHLVPAGRYKVYIVDEVHMFSKASFNLLLKTFEEPPAHVVFVLATTEPDKVPATVRGRCQRFDFRLFLREVLEALYRKIGDAEGIEAEPGAIELVARQAAGSARDGLTLMEQALTDDGRGLTCARVRALTGAVDRELVVEAVELMSRAEPAGVFPLVARVVDAGGDLRRFAEDVVGHLRGVMLAAAGASPQRLLDEVDDATAERMSQQATVLSAAGATSRLSILAEVAREVDNEALGRITLEAALVRCCRAEEDGLAARVAVLEARLARGGGFAREAGPEPAPRPHSPETVPPPQPSPDPAPRPHEPAAVPDDAPFETPSPEPSSTAAAFPTRPPVGAGALGAELDTRWRDVVAGVGAVVRALLDGSRPLALDDALLRVGVDQEFKVRKLTERKAELDAAAATAFGPGVKVVFEVAAAGATAPEPAAEEEDVDLSELTEAPVPDRSSVVELVKRGFAAEVVEEYGKE